MAHQFIRNLGEADLLVILERLVGEVAELLKLSYAAVELGQRLGLNALCAIELLVRIVARRARCVLGLGMMRLLRLRLQVRVVAHNL